MQTITNTYYLKGHRIAESETTEDKVVFTMAHHLLDMIRDDVSVAQTNKNTGDTLSIPIWKLKEKIKKSQPATYDVSFEIEYVFNPEDIFLTERLSLDDIHTTIDGTVEVEANDEEEAEELATNIICDETFIDDYDITITTVRKR